MTERERLSLMIEKSKAEYCQKCIDDSTAYHYGDYLADYLLENGIIVLPVKIGQSFWHIEEYKHELLPDEYPPAKVVCKSKVENIYIQNHGNSFGDTRKSFGFNDIGKTVFLIGEEAEQELCKISHNSLCETETYKGGE